MNRLGDYFYAAVPSVCLAIPFAQILPDLSFLMGIEKLGIIGIMAAGILFFVRERRSFIAKSGERLEAVEDRLGVLETKFSDYSRIGGVLFLVFEVAMSRFCSQLSAYCFLFSRSAGQR